MKRLIHTLLCPLLCMVLILSLIPVPGAHAVSQTSVSTEEAFYVVGNGPVFQTGWDELTESNRLHRVGDEWVITFKDVPMGYWEFAVTNGSEYWGNTYSEDNIQRFLAQGDGEMEISFDPVEEKMYFAYTYEPALPVPPMTIYCRAPEDWNSCYVFWGGSVNTCTEEIGEPMNHLGDDLWSLEVYSDVTYVVFTNGQGQQRSTNTPYNDEMLYDYTCDRWESPVQINQLSTVRVVGNASFMGNWDVSSDAGRMTRIGENLHEICFRDVAPGHYEFRITADANWNRCWSQGEENYTVDITQTTDLVVTLQSDIWGEGAVSIYQGAAEPSGNCYYVAGPGELCGIDWMPDAEENRMQYLGDGIWSKTYYDVAPGCYEILVTRNGYFEADIAPYEFEVPQTQSIQITFDSSSGIISVKGSIQSLEPTDDNENTDPDDTLSVQTLIILKSIILAFDLNNDGHFCLEDLITLWTRFQQIA